MQDLVQSGGWMMLPILISSVVALAIVRGAGECAQGAGGTMGF